MITDETKAAAWDNLTEFFETIIEESYNPIMVNRARDLQGIMNEALLANLNNQKLTYNGR